MDDEIKKNKTGSYTIKATTSLDDFNEYFDAELNDEKNDEKLDTIGDLIVQKIGYLPKQNELVKIEQFHFKVVHGDHRKIYLLEFVKDSMPAD